MAFVIPEVPKHTSTTIPLRKFTPARVKFGNGNRENGVRKTVDKKVHLPDAGRLHRALKEINNQMRTPETKVSLNGYKITREKERTHRNLVHPYITPKLKRLGSTPSSASKMAKSLKSSSTPSAVKKVSKGLKI